MQARDLERSESGHWSRREGEQNLVRQVESGHTIGDHSFDHMFHNNDEGRDGNRNVYRDISEDLEYFGEMNFKKVRELMDEADISSREQRRVSKCQSGGRFNEL